MPPSSRAISASSPATLPAIASSLGLKRWRVYELLQERGVLRSQSDAGRLEQVRRRAGEVWPTELEAEVLRGIWPASWRRRSPTSSG